MSGAEDVSDVDAVALGQRLRAFRGRTGLTQAAVAQRIGVHQTGYSAYETGLRPPGLAQLVALADLFRVTLDDLAGRRPSDDLPEWTCQPERLRAAREAAGRSVADLAAAVGVSAEAYEKYEREPTLLPLSRLRRILAALDSFTLLSDLYDLEPVVAEARDGSTVHVSEVDDPVRDGEVRQAVILLDEHTDEVTRRHFDSLARVTHWREPNTGCDRYVLGPMSRKELRAVFHRAQSYWSGEWAFESRPGSFAWLVVAMNRVMTDVLVAAMRTTLDERSHPRRRTAGPRAAAPLARLATLCVHALAQTAATAGTEADQKAAEALLGPLVANVLADRDLRPDRDQPTADLRAAVLADLTAESAPADATWSGRVYLGGTDTEESVPQPPSPQRRRAKR